MFKGDRNFTVGLFVSIAITAFIAFVIWLTGRSGVEEMTRYSLMFRSDVSGLAVGGPVKYMGMNIGSVVQMKLEREENIQVRVDVEILASTPVDTGTYASLALQGITGVAVVNLASEPGDHPPLQVAPGREYPVIPVRILGFSAVMSSLPEIMSKLDHLLTQAGNFLGEENQAAVNGALEDIGTLTSALAANSDSVGAIPGDLRSTLSEIQKTVAQLQDVISDLQPGINSTMANFRQSSENLAALTARMDALLLEHEKDIARFMEQGLGEAPSLMQEMRNTLRDLQKFMAEIKDDPSQFIHRPSTDHVE